MRSAFRFGSSFVVALALVWCGAARAADNMTNADTSPQDILSKIHTVNQQEIKMAKVAMQKGHSPEVKKFAQQMIKDHTMADQKVMKLAKQEKITLGQYPMTAMQQGQMDKLAAATGAEFDRLYMETNRTGHNMAIEMLKNAQKQTSDPKVKALVTQLLPTVEHHEHLAKEIQPDNVKSAS
jgi:putative membrane protein